MTKAEAFDKSMRLTMKGDFSLHDEIIHQDYESINSGISINKEMSKEFYQRLVILLSLARCTRSTKMKNFYVYNVMEETD